MSSLHEQLIRADRLDARHAPRDRSDPSPELRKEATAQHNASQTADSHAFKVTGFDLKPGVTT